jgi:hypothetical protein
MLKLCGVIDRQPTTLVIYHASHEPDREREPTSFCRLRADANRSVLREEPNSKWRRGLWGNSPLASSCVSNSVKPYVRHVSCHRVESHPSLKPDVSVTRRSRRRERKVTTRRNSMGTSFLDTRCFSFKSMVGSCAKRRDASDNGNINVGTRSSRFSVEWTLVETAPSRV